MQAYLSAAQTSEQFYIRLLEIAALAVHALAGSLYTASHPSVDIYSVEFGSSQYPHYPPDLHHKRYHRYEFYPYGLLDGAGYWPEAQNFGGVLLLEHNRSDNEVCTVDSLPQICSNIKTPLYALGVFIHPQSLPASQLSDRQVRQQCEMEQRQNITSTRTTIPLPPFEPEVDVNTTEFKAANVFRDKFSLFYPDSVINRPSCVVPMTEEMSSLIAWANGQFASIVDNTA